MANDRILCAKSVIAQRFKLHSIYRVIKKRRFGCFEINDFGVI